MSSTSGAATVSVSDDDLPPPQASITAGSGVTEGGNAVFTITVSPAPAAALTVNLNVSQSGAYIGASDAGSKTVTVPTSGSATYTVATVDDAVDEADGSVKVTLNAGTGYAVSSTSGAATVSVSDDEEPEFPAVTALTVIELTATSATLAWPGIADSDYYALTWYSSDAPDPQEEILTRTGFEITGLQPNTAYSVSVLGFAKEGTIYIIGSMGFTTEAPP